MDAGSGSASANVVPFSKNPPNATFNVYQAADDHWFVIVVLPKDWPAFAKAIGHPELLADTRFTDAATQAANSGQLTAILDEVFRSQPLAYWREALDRARERLIGQEER